MLTWYHDTAIFYLLKIVKKSLQNKLSTMLTGCLDQGQNKPPIELVVDNHAISLFVNRSNTAENIVI